ncbi:GGDEF domain-containing response regulator [Chitinibacter tainanensis]|uniref:GGDEF domain-containing response regulator n=1 Tax=Chitinibacter tainanensis TaxID=230667 RepID=UPI00041AC191|nr:diguanylate cyclase [Chitinibacter tainanensis]
MSNSIILCVDDDPNMLQALRNLLFMQLGPDCFIELAESGAEALAICEELIAEGQEISVIVSDYIMPGLRGDELLVQIHQQSPNTVKILLTGQSDIDGVKRSINKANLYRFIEKPFVNEDLVLTIRAAEKAYQQERTLERQNAHLTKMNNELEILVAERTKELIEKNKQLEQLSQTDKLTGLFNRHKLDLQLAEEVLRCQRGGNAFSLIIADVDHFKNINDTYGHPAGDEVLVSVAKTLQAQSRAIDIVGRWGGEEFLILSPVTELAGALQAAEHYRSAIAASKHNHALNITASFGVASYQENDTVNSILARVDHLLYQAKNSGRNCVRG